MGNNQSCTTGSGGACGSSNAYGLDKTGELIMGPPIKDERPAGGNTAGWDFKADEK